jgi:uncharacterized phage protein gp47/JayE
VNFSDRTYPDIVMDLLTVLTGGTVAETHSIGAEVPDLLHLDHRPVRRVSHLKGKVRVGEKLIDYRFTDRDFELVGTEANPTQFVGLRFRARGQKPAPNTVLTVNYYPERLRPTPLTDVNVGSVTRTVIETVGRELATQYQQLQTVYESAFVETARGDSLDKVAALVDTLRLRQGHAVGKVRFSRRSGSPGSVFIPVSTAIGDGDGSRYLTSSDATLLPSQATIEVWVHGDTPSTKPVDAGSLTVLERAIAGIDRVTNDEATFRASEDETDDQLRIRARRAIHATGTGTLDALRYGLEGLPFVSAVTVAEYPEPAVPLPGMLRVDIALSEDNELNRAIADGRLHELRPAGIYVERHWAGKVSLGFRVDLVLAGASLQTSVISEIKDGVTERLVAYARDLGPGESLRTARVVSLVMQDDRVADARVSITADGTPISGDTYPLPTGKAAAVATTAPVAFGSVTFEQAAGAQQPVIVHLDADLSATSLTIDKAALETLLRTRLETVAAGLQPNLALTFDQLATAVRDDAKFALVRSRSVFGFDQEGGGFTELRDNDPAFPVPVNATVRVRSVRITETAT